MERSTAGNPTLRAALAASQQQIAELLLPKQTPINPDGLSIAEYAELAAAKEVFYNETVRHNGALIMRVVDELPQMDLRLTTKHPKYNFDDGHIEEYPEAKYITAIEGIFSGGAADVDALRRLQAATIWTKMDSSDLKPVSPLPIFDEFTQKRYVNPYTPIAKATVPLYIVGAKRVEDEMEVLAVNPSGKGTVEDEISIAPRLLGTSMPMSNWEYLEEKLDEVAATTVTSKEVDEIRLTGTSIMRIRSGSRYSQYLERSAQKPRTRQFRGSLALPHGRGLFSDEFVPSYVKLDDETFGAFDVMNRLNKLCVLTGRASTFMAVYDAWAEAAPVDPVSDKVPPDYSSPE